MALALCGGKTAALETGKPEIHLMYLWLPVKQRHKDDSVTELDVTHCISQGDTREK